MHIANVDHYFYNIFFRFSWQSILLQFEDLDRLVGADNLFHYELKNLNGNTRYGYYVKTQVSFIHNGRDAMHNIIQGQSQIRYFKTQTHRPMPPFVTTLHKTNESLTITWYTPPQWENHPYITYFTADVFVRPDPLERLAERNYCLEPKEPEKVTVISNEDKEPCPCWGRNDDDVVLTTFVGVDGPNDACGIDEPHCNEHFQNYDSKKKTSDSLMETSVYRQLYDQIAFPLPYNSQYDEQAMYEMHHHDPTKQSNYMYSRNITDVKTTHYVIGNLTAYTQYEIQFRACNGLHGCSSYFLYQERTVSDERGDYVELTLRIDRVQYNTVHIQILPPARPSGPTVAYVLEHTDTNNLTQHMCMTRQQHERRNHTVTLYHLQIGQHHFRVRSISLGADSAWSKQETVNILSPNFMVRHLSSKHFSLEVFFLIAFCICASFIALFILVCCVGTLKWCAPVKQQTDKVYDVGPAAKRMQATYYLMTSCLNEKKKPPSSSKRRNDNVSQEEQYPLVTNTASVAITDSPSSPDEGVQETMLVSIDVHRPPPNESPIEIEIVNETVNYRIVQPTSLDAIYPLAESVPETPTQREWPSTQTKLDNIIGKVPPSGDKEDFWFTPTDKMADASEDPSPESDMLQSIIDTIAKRKEEIPAEVISKTSDTISEIDVNISGDLIEAEVHASEPKETADEPVETDQILQLPTVGSLEDFSQLSTASGISTTENAPIIFKKKKKKRKNSRK